MTTTNEKPSVVKILRKPRSKPVPVFTPSEIAIDRFLDRMTVLAAKILRPLIGDAPLSGIEADVIGA